MSVLTEEQAKALLQKVVGLSKADESVATLSGSLDGNVRFALNDVSTSALVDTVDLSVQSAYGRRVGTATTNQFDEASLLQAVRRSEELAKFAPENAEFMPALAEQNYEPSSTFAQATAAITPEYRAKVAADCIEPCRRDKMVAAGFFSDSRSFVAMANSKGNFGYQKSTGADFTCTVRTADARGSGWVARNLGDVAAFDPGGDIKTAIGKARDSVDAKALEPGKYTVVLEPNASAQLMLFLVGSGFDAREADEGRSFLARKGGGNRLGDQVFDEQVTLHADPWDRAAPVLPWDDDGVPRERVPIVTRGKVENLVYSRYWASRQGKKASAQCGNLIMAGGDKSTLDLVRSTRKGVLVTRMYYVNIVDPQTMQLTGLTRDGTFYIENGEIRYPIKNFRFNESAVVAFNNIEELGRPVRVATFEMPMPMLLPPMKIRDFTFTSLSDAV